MDITQRIQLEYPYEIAETYRSYCNLVNLADGDPSSRVLKLLELFEVLLKTLCAVNTKWFLASNPADGNVQKELEAFKKPSIGNWLGLFREVSWAIKSSNRVSAPPLVDAITKFYDSKVDRGSKSEVAVACNELAEMYGKKEVISKLTNGTIFDLCGALRNKVQAHGALQALSKTESEVAAKGLHTILHHLLMACDFLCNYEVLYIAEVKKKSGVFRYTAKSCRGSRINNSSLLHPEDTSAPIEDGEVYACSVERESTPPTITWALSLSPYLVLASCKECKSDQVFVFNGARGNSLEYLSYQCGHSYDHAGLSNEFENIRKLLRGEISRAKVFAGHVLGETFPEEPALLTLQERLVAERKANQAIQLINEHSFALAQDLAEEALKEDRDSVHANYALALICIRDGDLKGAREHFDKAVHLSPEHRPSLLGMALVCAELDDIPTGDRYLQSLLQVDPTNTIGRSLSQVSLAAAVHVKTAEGASDKQEAAYELISRIQSAERDQTVKIRPFLELLPPWSIVARLPMPTIVSSFLIAALTFTIVLLTHMDSWGPVFHLRVGIVSLIIFLGLWYPFAFAALLRRHFTKLECVTLMPSDTFQRWYLSQVAYFFGLLNLSAPRGQQEDFEGVEFCVDQPLATMLSELYPPEYSSEIWLLKDSYFRDHRALGKRLEEMTGIAISQADIEACVQRATSDWSARKQRIRNKFDRWLSRLHTDGRLLRWTFVLVLIGSWFNITAASAYFALRDVAIVLVAIFEVYTVVWLIPFFLGSIRLVPEIIKLPVRYHIGLPTSLSLVVLGDFYLALAAFMTPINIAFFFQHYIWRTHIGAPIAMVGGSALVMGALILILIGPQLALCQAFGSLKQRKLREYAGTIERTFNDLLSQPTEEGFRELQNQKKVIQYLTRNLPSTGFSFASCLAFIILSVLNLGCFIGYVFAIVYGYWPWPDA